MSVGVAPLSNLLAVGRASGYAPEALTPLPALPTDNHAQLSRASLRIRILDVNDNPPELATPYEAAVCEDAKPGQVPTGAGDQRCCHERARLPLLIVCPASLHPTAHPNHQRGGQGRTPGWPPLLFPPGTGSTQQPSFLSAGHRR